MTHIQLSIFLENKKGRLLDVCSFLGQHAINIRALTVAESDNFGVLRILVKDPHGAAKILKEHGFVVHETEVVAVEVNDKPGGLANVLNAINKNHINVEYMYGFVEPSAAKAMMVFRFDNPSKACEALKEAKIPVVGHKDLADM
jgi:hypothetical protein